DDGPSRNTGFREEITHRRREKKPTLLVQLAEVFAGKHHGFLARWLRPAMGPALRPEQEIQLGFHKPPVLAKFKGRHTPVLDVAIESPRSHFKVAAGLGGGENLIAHSFPH